MLHPYTEDKDTMYYQHLHNNSLFSASNNKSGSTKAGLKVTDTSTKLLIISFQLNKNKIQSPFLLETLLPKEGKLTAASKAIS